MFKSTGDYASGKALYDKYTAVSEDFLSLRTEVRDTPVNRSNWAFWGSLRPVYQSSPSWPPSVHGLAQVLATRLPRKLHVQHVTRLTETGSVDLLTFPATAAGLILSTMARFPASDPELMALWHADRLALNPVCC